MEYAALISAGVAALSTLGGAIGGSVNREKAEQERKRAYDEYKSYLNSEYYRDPLSTIGNKALLKGLDQRMKKQNEALENRAIAGGATMENQLAARKANNEVMGNVFSNLLQGEDARRLGIDRQKMQAAQDFASGIQANYAQAAQDWQTWGAQTANAAMQYGATKLV